MIGGLGDKIYLTTISLWSWRWQVDNKPDELARTVLTVSVPILILIWYKWATSTLPPGPYGLPVLGYLPFLSTNLHEKFTEMGHKYGPIFSLRLGSKLYVVVNSIDLVKVITRDLDHSFANRDPPVTAKTLTYDATDIIWSNNTSHWRNMRKILAIHILNRENLIASESFRTCEVRKTVNQVFAKIATNININEITFNTMVNTVTNMLWGGSKSGEGKDSSYIGNGFHEIEINMNKLVSAPNISDFLPLLSRFDLQGRKREMKRCFEFVDEIFDKIIEERINVNSRKIEGSVEEDGKKDFLQMLLEIKDQKDAHISLDIIAIKALLMDVVLAATDTTSTMVEWVMAEILHYPGVLRKVQDELTTIVGVNDILQEYHLPKLTYLDAVVKETFRLHPPFPFLVHRCPNKSSTLGGYKIPKGSIVYMNMWAIHSDPQNWTNPLEFKPERFLKDDKWDYSGNNFMFLPFGSGRRMCPGIVLGEKMLMYILASLLHSFEWSLPKDEEFDLSDEFGLVTKKRKPLIAIPTQRLPNASLYMG